MMINVNTAKYKFRSKEVTPTTIICPLHVRQKTYLLYDEDDFHKGLGCCKCFEHLKVTQNKIVFGFKEFIEQVTELMNEKEKEIDYLLFKSYKSEFEVIDGLNQHPYGIDFETWKRKFVYKTEKI